MRTNNLLLFILAAALFSCDGGSAPAKEEIPNTPTSGTVKVFCEEGFSLPMKRQIFTFEELYHNAKIKAEYVNEKQAVEGLYNDCCKVIVLSRILSNDELKKFKAANIYPKQTCIAKNAVAFVVDRSSKDTVITKEKIFSLLSGEDSSLYLVFDNENSGVAKYLKDSVLLGKPFGKNCFAAKNTEELVKLMGERKNAIGVLDFSWISDTDETITQKILSGIRPLAISTGKNKTAYYPDQSNIETKDYPYCRYTYISRRSADFTLGAGLIAFVAGQKGQLIMLKAGLIPAFRQERVVEINTAPLGNQ